MSQDQNTLNSAVLVAGEQFIRAAHAAMPGVHPMFAAQIALRSFAAAVKDEHGRTVSLAAFPVVATDDDQLSGGAGGHGLTAETPAPPATSPAGLGTSRRYGGRIWSTSRPRVAL